MSKRKNPEGSPQLPFPYSGGTEPSKPYKPELPAKERAEWDKNRRRDDSIHNATYGKSREKNQNQSASLASRLSGEFLRKNYAQIEEWRKKYEETSQIPAQFDINDKKRAEFFRLIGWR